MRSQMRFRMKCSPTSVVAFVVAAVRARHRARIGEVGVDEGLTSERLLRELPRLRLVGVDPYPGVYAGVVSGERTDGMGSSAMLARAEERYAAFQGRAELWRMSSLGAARSHACARRRAQDPGDFSSMSRRPPLRLLAPPAQDVATSAPGRAHCSHGTTRGMPRLRRSSPRVLPLRFVSHEATLPAKFNIGADHGEHSEIVLGGYPSSRDLCAFLSCSSRTLAFGESDIVELHGAALSRGNPCRSERGHTACLR